MYGFLYITLNLITGEKYIGQCSYKKIGTWKSYLGSGTKLKKDIEKYGREYFFRTIIKEYETKEELLQAERDLIDLLKANEDVSFYNCVRGGLGESGRKLTKEQKENLSKKISAAYTDSRKKETSERMKTNNPNADGHVFRGKHLSEEQKKKISEVNKGKPGLCGPLNPMFGRKGVLNPNYGKSQIDRRLTEEHKQKLSETKKGAHNGMARAVLRIEDKKLFGSIREAATFVGVNTSTIIRVCNGTKKICKGYTWRFATDEDIELYKHTYARTER